MQLGWADKRMATDLATSEPAGAPISRYTAAMVKCLGSLSARADLHPSRTIVHALINLVQGRMVEYLADRICREFGVRDEGARERIVTALLTIFRDEFFALFRTKIEFRPGLVVDLARHIIRKEVRQPPSSASATPLRLPSDRLFPAIFRKYFEYRNLGHLLEMVESDAEIQKIVLEALLRERLGEARECGHIADILAGDRDGAAASVFMTYFRQGRESELSALVECGDWRDEAESIKRRTARMRGQ